MTIAFWQYDHASKVTEMTALTKKFEAQRPDVAVKQATVLYDER